MLNQAGIESGLGQASRRDLAPPPNPNANCQAPAGRSRVLSDPGLTLPASDRTKTATLAHLAEPFVVLLLVVGTAVAAWVHLRNSSIWYDEAVTLLTTSGHAELEGSRGLSQFMPSANLGKILIDLYHRDVHPPLYFWTLGFGVSDSENLWKWPVLCPYFHRSNAGAHLSLRQEREGEVGIGPRLGVRRVSCPRGRGSTRYRAG